MNKVKIIDVCNIQVGKTPSRYNPLYWGKGSLWLSIADMNQGLFFDKTKERITEKAIKECKCKIVPKDTVLFSFKLSIGKVGITKLPMYTNEAIAAFIIKDSSLLDTKYLSYVLKSVDYSIGSNKAVMGKTLNKELLKKIVIPLPLLQDQKNIVKILDKAEALRQKRKQAIELLDEYLKSTFLEMFGDPISNPNNWQKMQIKEFGDIVTGNTPARNTLSYYSEKHIEWIKTDNILQNSIYISKATEYLSESGLQKARSVKAGSLLVACIAGSFESIGRSALTDREVSFNQQINAIQPYDTVNSVYLYWLFKLTRKYIQEHATKGMKKILTKGAFQKIEMIMPPIEIQNKFAEIADKQEKIKQKMLTQSLELDNQFQALMQNHL